MPIKPENSYVLFQYAGSTSTLYCEDISFSQVSEPFERPEYKRDVQRKALESNGTAPLIVQLIYGVPAQITSTGLVTTTPRSLLPDDGVLANIYQKLFATRYVLKGTTSTNSDTGLMFTWSTAHRQLQDMFVVHSKYAQAAVSIQELAALEAGNFNYLTNTGLTLVSGAIGTINNLLIRDFSVNLDYYLPSDGTNLYVWQCTVDSITILSDLP
jgi:hypothetical protein